MPRECWGLTTGVVARGTRVEKASQPTRKPNSVCRGPPEPFGSARVRRDDHSSRPGIARGLQRPTRRLRTGRPIAAPANRNRGAALFGLAPCGVLPATDVTAGAVRSYRTFSPLPSSTHAKSGGIFSVPLSVRLLCPGVTRRTALRSSDFPPAFAVGFGAASSRLPHCCPYESRRSSGRLRPEQLSLAASQFPCAARDLTRHLQ